jgi:hypothetical protein
VECELIPSKLGSAPAYEALSYRAGDPSEFRALMLNRFPFNTFRSTHEALMRFRDLEEAVVMWIDQICI